MMINGKSILGVLVFLVFAGIVGAFVMTYSQWEGQEPEIAFDREVKAIGRATPLALTVQDAGTGLKTVAIRLKQNDQDVVLAEETFEQPEKSKTYDLAKLIAEKYKIQQGPASINVSATDHSYRGLMGGNTSEVTRDFEFDLYPPRLEILSGQHYINQGGTECVVYRVSEDAISSGVQVGPHFFKGFPAKQQDANVHFALFAFAYDLPPATPVKVIARDAAGNQAEGQPWQKVFPKPVRSRNIPIDDPFLQKVVPEIMSNTRDIQDQGELIKTFVELNSKLRRQNHEAIAKLAAESPGELLWNGAFLQLSNSQVESLFADRRTYIYQGKPVDQQDHVGFDLSVVQRYPIEAANDGKVILGDYFGIYGNTVLIDHGAGLISLYGHLSSIDVKPGQMVKKKDVLGRSGATGMAGGDHLHFGLFLHGVPVNPTEWWDAKWIQEHVLDRLKPSPAPTSSTP